MCNSYHNVTMFHVLLGSGHWKITFSVVWLRGKVLVVLISESEDCILLSIILCFIVQNMLDSLSMNITLFTSYTT